MVIDFGFIKELMIETIHDPCDHGLILYEYDNVMIKMVTSEDEIGFIPLAGVKLLLLPYVPTAENLARYWFDHLQTAMRVFWLKRDDIDINKKPWLHSITVHETPNCQAIYPAE